MCFLSTIFPNAPAHPPPPLYFLTSPLLFMFVVHVNAVYNDLWLMNKFV